MKPFQNQSPLDSDPIYSRVLELIQSGEFNTSIARTLHEEYGLNCNETTIRRFRKRHKVSPYSQREYTTITGDLAEANTPIVRLPSNSKPPVLDDPDAMLRQRGLDPEEWTIDSIVVNQWNSSEDVTNYQAKFTAKKKRPELQLQPVRSEGWTPHKPVKKSLKSDSEFSELIVVVGDQQAPFYDKNLHRLFLEWLRYNQPSRGIILGDLIDFPDISRHPDDPDNVASAQECLQAGYEILRDYVDASPYTEWQFLRGNHDQRLRSYIIEKAPRIYDLHRALTEAEQEKEFAHSLSWLMRFDELGIEYVDTNGSYEDAQVVLSKNLAVKHGWVVRSGSGTSALKTLEQTHHSIIIGHTHRQSQIFNTQHDVDRTPTTHVAVESGCMCQMDNQPDASGRRFPSYGVYPNWQQGFCSINLYEDGKFYVSLANYVNKTLLYQDQRYE